MKDLWNQITRFCGAFITVLALCGAICSAAHADVYGRLRFIVTDADTDKPLVGAAVTLHDPTGTRGDATLTLDAQGAATSDPLEVHPWQVKTALSGYDSDTRSVSVAADTTTEVDIALEKTEKVINITGHRVLTQPSQPANVTDRNQSFIQKYPTSSNPQDLKSLITTTPGFVSSSVGVAHPRGEHNQVTIYVDGALLPGALQGKAGQILSPQVIQNADIQTGSYAPEYGSESAAILNLSLRSGTITPFQTFTLQGGGYNTSFGEFTVGGQFGPTLEPGVSGPVPRKFSYLLDLSDRYTADSLEPPQPDDQSAHNHGVSESAFGNFEYDPDTSDAFSLYLNSTPAHTEIANRTGLSSKYAPVGQGYGYGGARNADGGEAGIAPDPSLLGSAVEALPSQQAAGQDISQSDDNNFSILNYRHMFNSQLTGLLTVGANHANLDIKNNNPSIDLDSLNPDGTLTQTDNSIEYNPTVLRHSTEEEAGGSLTLSQNTHTYKAGFIFQNQVGDESYQFIPQSQLALDALAGIQGNGPQLTPNGSVEMDANGNPVLDALGDPVYLITPGSTTPTVMVHHSGYYDAGYVQDTWRATRKLTVNYGLRLDNYFSTENLGQAEVNSIELSPRLNTAYAFTPSTVGRLSYNRLFTQPPLTQGAILGSALKPETLDLYEASVQHQIGSTQTVKIDAYYKNIRNQIDTGILIPYTQVGAYTTLQYQYASVHGLELSYNLQPRNNVGLGGYASLTDSLAKPGGLDQTGAPAPIINDHDQRYTVSAGLSYTLPSGAFGGADYYFGSGEASTVLAPISPNNPNVLNNGDRISNQELNLRLVGPPHLLGFGTAELDVDNVFNDLSVLNFNSGFSGTRFQEGRTVLLSVTGSL
jgi:outer membrane receptor protein involved in Fe transport